MSWEVCIVHLKLVCRIFLDFLGWAIVFNYYWKSIVEENIVLTLIDEVLSE